MKKKIRIGRFRIFAVKSELILGFYNYFSTNQKHKHKKMSIQSSQTISQSLYTAGTLNPKKNKSQKRKNKTKNH